MKAIYLLPEQNFPLIYGPDEQRDIAARVELVAPRQDAQSIWQQPIFTDVEAIFSGWGMMKMDAAFFERFPNLKVLFYGAGAVDRFITEEVWSRGVEISNANVANGTSVAEYTVAQILLCLKQAWSIALRIKQEQRYLTLSHNQVTGAYGSTVGIISLGAIGRMVAERLRIAKVNIIAYDPHVSREQAQASGIELTTLDDLFRRADVITCHTPWLPETEGMLHGALFRSMKPNAAFINTARGAIVNEPDLCAVLRERPDLFAILDVTWPEPPALDSPLFTLPNLMLTPHIAGSMGHECWRMGRMMVEELDRWLAGEPLQHRVTRTYARARG